MEVASSARNHFRALKVARNQRNNEEESEAEISEGEEFLSEEEENLQNEGEQDDEDEETGDGEEDHESKIQWYHLDSPLNRAVRRFRADLDDPNSMVRKRMKEGFFRFSPPNPTMMLRKQFHQNLDTPINFNDFCMKEVT